MFGGDYILVGIGLDSKLVEIVGMGDECRFNARRKMCAKKDMRWAVRYEYIAML